MIKIRLTRQGRKNAPLFSIVATNSRNKRDGRQLDKLGQYNPELGEAQALSNLNVEGIKGWVSKGAELSDTVRTLLKRGNVQL